MSERKSSLDFKEIGIRIRIEREDLKLSREKFAEIIGLSSYYIGQIERGERNMSLETLIKISNSLNISIDYILKGSIIYMENIAMLEAIENNYKAEMDTEIKELLTLISGSPREKIQLIKDITKLIIPYKGK